MEDQSNNNESTQYVGRDRKDAGNRSIISKYENSISNIKNQVYELKSKLQRPPTEIYNEVIPEESSFQGQSHFRSEYEIHQPPFEEVMNINHRLEAELREARADIEKKNGELIHMSEQINFLNRKMFVSKENISPNINTDVIDKLRSKLEFLERQNADYIDKIARLENDAIVQRTQTSLPLTGEHSEGDRSGPKFRIQRLELDRIKLIESNEYLNEKVNQVQLAYNAMREQLDSNIQKYEALLDKVKDNEDDKHKYILHAKKLDDQLKSLNNNYTTLQKKVTGLEKDNKDLSDELKNMEAEKRNVSEKWQKLSKKVKIDDTQKISVRALESDLAEKTKEVEEFREKFVSAKTELQILRESERTYKDIIEAKTREVKEQQEKAENGFRDKEGLLKQNLELIEKLEKAQGDLEQLRRVEISYHEKEELNQLKSSINTFQMLARKLELEKMEITKKMNEALIDNEKLQKKKHELEQGYEKAKNDVIFMNTKWNHLLREFEKLQAEHMRSLSHAHNEQELLASLDKGLPFGRVEPEEILVTYEPMKDDIFQATRREIDKIRGFDEGLYRLVDSAFNHYASSVKTKIECNDVSARYNRLLVKYYKVIERNKDLQKFQDLNENFDQANESMSHPSQNNSLTYSGPKVEPKVVGFASNHRKRSDSDPHLEPRNNETLKLQKVLMENDGHTPIKYAFSTQKANRHHSTGKKSGSAGILRASFNDSRHIHKAGAVGPIVQLNDFVEPRSGKNSNLEEELKNEILNAKTLKENTSLEKLGLRIVNKEIDAGPLRNSTPLGNDRYLRILKNTLGPKVDEPKRRSSAMVKSSSNVKSYMDMHHARRDQLNNSGIINNSSFTTQSGMNQSYSKNNL